MERVSVCLEIIIITSCTSRSCKDVVYNEIATYFFKHKIIYDIVVVTLKENGKIIINQNKALFSVQKYGKTKMAWKNVIVEDMIMSNRSPKKNCVLSSKIYVVVKHV